MFAGSELELGAGIYCRSGSGRTKKRAVAGFMNPTSAWRWLCCSRQRWVALGVLLGLVILLAFRLTQKITIHNQLIAIRKSGAPVALTELNQWYAAVPNSSNAALIYEKAFALLKMNQHTRAILHFERTNALINLRGITAERKANIEAVLANNVQAMTLLHEGSKLSRSRYSVDMTKGFDLRMPHLRSLSHAVRLLCLKAGLEAIANHPQAACEAIHDGLCLAQSLADEPRLNSEQVRLGMITVILDALEPLLGTGIFGEAQIGDLSELLQRIETSDKLVRVLAGERCFIIQVFDLSAKEFFGPNADFEKKRIIWFQKCFGMWDHECITILDFLKDDITAASLPYPDRLARVQEQGKRLDAIYDHEAFLSLTDLMPWQSLAAIMLPDTLSLHDQFAETRARLQAAQVALAIERYRLANARALPETLSNLTPGYLSGVPVDLYDGKPLRYHKLDSGYVVYSVGSDGVDNGGLSKRKSKRDGQYDVLFTVKD